MSLWELTTETRIAFSMGAGGVGKTTLAAMLGLQAAVAGRRALVITIDPAMRLADALGLGDVPPGEHRVIPRKQMIRLGIPARTDLTVAVLDTGRSLTELIRREVPATQLRKRILAHPFFCRLCDDLAGSREYAAMEEIHHLYLQGLFDLLVVDTPPTTHSLDFLQAADRVLDVLEHRSYRWLMRPALLAGRIGLKKLDFSGGYVVRTLSKFTGTTFLRELATFVDLFSGLMEGFRQRAAAFKVILRSASCSFVLVTTTDPNRAEETLFLHRRLSSRNLVPDTVVVNRITPKPAALPNQPGWQERLVGQLSSALGNADGWNHSDLQKVIQGMLQAHAFVTHIAERDAACEKQFEASLGTRSSVVSVPLMHEDIHDMVGLENLRRAIFEPGGNP